MPRNRVPVRIDPGDFDWSSSEGPAARVRAVAAAADAADGVVSLNEAAQLRLKHRGLDGATLVLDDLADTTGFALLAGRDLDLVVSPDARSRGVGLALAREVLDGVEEEVDAWSHSDCPAAARIADRLGLPRERELWVMSRPLDDSLPPAEPGSGYTVRAFRDGDEEGLLETNSLAFSHHPEQGHMSLADFRERQSEDWFDPAGLFLAVGDDGQILGFHWTKVHREENLGEVYVVAVNPRAAGRGIGKVLTNAGLLHLRSLGLPTVILYVDGDNAPAIAVYDGAGFSRVRVEAQYRGVPQVLLPDHGHVLDVTPVPSNGPSSAEILAELRDERL